jgi:chromosome partitioning protein
MANVIAIVNEKGGVGKTTTALNLGYALQASEKRILLIDLSTQGSLSKLLGHDVQQLDEREQTVIFSLTDNVPMASLIQSGYLDVVPSWKSSGRKRPHSLTVLREALAPLQAEYDYVLIDCPPEIERLMVLALIAADQVLIPTKVDRLSTDGIADLIRTIAQVRRHHNPNLGILGILPTMFKRGHLNDIKYLKALRLFEKRGVKVFEPIHENTNFLKAAEEGRAAIERYPRTPGVLRYYHLADHILHHE